MLPYLQTIYRQHIYVYRTENIHVLYVKLTLPCHPAGLVWILNTLMASRPKGDAWIQTQQTPSLVPFLLVPSLGARGNKPHNRNQLLSGSHFATVCLHTAQSERKKMMGVRDCVWLRECKREIRTRHIVVLYIKKWNLSFQVMTWRVPDKSGHESLKWFSAWRTSDRSHREV